jgi:hypothetical protein
MQRRPTKVDLLPLPKALVAKQQLKHHISLAMMRNRTATVSQLGMLINAIQIAYLLEDRSRGEDVTEVYQHAEMALEQCIRRAGDGGPIELFDDEASCLEEVLRRYDQKMLIVQTRTYMAAQERASKLAAAKRSAIPLPEKKGDSR